MEAGPRRGGRRLEFVGVGFDHLKDLANARPSIGGRPSDAVGILVVAVGLRRSIRA